MQNQRDVKMENEDIVCGICGFNDNGKYCSNCGSPLLGSDASALEVPKQILYKVLIQDWVEYFRTVFFVTTRPTWFFQGLYEDSGFIHSKKIATYPSFFGHNIVFISVLQSLVFWAIYGATLDDNYGFPSFSSFFEDALWSLLEITLFFLSAAMLHAYVLGRTKKGNPDKKYDIKRSMVGVIYCQGILIFTVPFQLLLGMALGGEDYLFDEISNPLIVTTIALSVAMSFIYKLHTVPVCFHFAYGIKLGEARIASFGFHQAISQVQKLILRLVF